MEKKVTIDIYVPEIRLLVSDYGWEGFRFSIPLNIFYMGKRKLDKNNFFQQQTRYSHLASSSSSYFS